LIAIEFGFIYVIYTIFLNLSNATKNEETKVAEKSRYHFMMISDQKR